MNPNIDPDTPSEITPEPPHPTATLPDDDDSDDGDSDDGDSDDSISATNRSQPPGRTSDYRKVFLSRKSKG